MKALIVITAGLLLTACGGRAAVPAPQPVIVTKEVKVPVGIGCVPPTYDAKRPEYVDTDKALRAAADAAVRYQLLWGGRAQRQAREKENEAVISGCPRGTGK